MFVLLLSLGGGGGYVWFAQQAAKAASQQHLDEIRTNFDEREGQAYQDLGDMDPDMQQQEEAAAGAAASAAVAAVGAAAADALAAGVAMAKVLTPSFKVCTLAVSLESAGVHTLLIPGGTAVSFISSLL